MRQGPWTAQYVIHANASAAAAFTNMPAADTFLFSSHRHVTLISVEGMSHVRLKVNKQATAGAVGSKLILRYSPVFSTSVASYTDIGASEVSVPIDSVNTFVSSPWIDLDPSVFVYDDIFIAVIGNGGNGTLDPSLGNISVSFA